MKNQTNLLNSYRVAFLTSSVGNDYPTVPEPIF
jgi:hypothetical protein